MNFANLAHLKSNSIIKILRLKNKTKEHKNNFHTRWLSVAEATTQINPFGNNILKHTLHQFASEFPLCFLKNIRIIKNLCVSKIILPLKQIPNRE